MRERRGASFLQLDAGDRPATVTVRFLQVPAATLGDPCARTVRAQVRGLRRFRLAGEGRPATIAVANLRNVRWQHWNRAAATGEAIAGDRAVTVTAFRVRGGQGRPYRYTRLRVSGVAVRRTYRV